MEFCGNVCKISTSGLHSLDYCLCFVHFMFHKNALEFLIFFTQTKYGSHTIAHEHAPNCLIHWVSVQLLTAFPNFEHTFCSPFFVSEWLNVIDGSSLVSIFLRNHPVL